MTESSLLVARSLARSWRRYPLRAWASTLGALVGIMLATLVAGVTSSVAKSIQAGTAVHALRADLVVAARSVNGMDDATAQRVAHVPGVRAAAPTIHVNTRLAGRRSGVLALVGVPAGAARFAPKIELVRSKVAPRPGTYALAVGKSWADRYDLRPGSVVRLVGPRGSTRWTITALLTGDVLNDGALAVARIDRVAQAFERGPHVDAVYVQAKPGVKLSQLAQRLRAATGGAATVGSPTAVLGPELASFQSVRTMLVIVGLVALATAGVVLFVCWRLLLEDERLNVARFRLNGAGRRELALGSGVVLLGGTLAAAAVGIPLGLVAAHLVSGYSRDLVDLTGLAAVPQGSGWLVPTAVGLGAGLAMSGAAWAAGLRSLVRIPAIEAIRAPSPGSDKPVPVLALAAAGVAAVAAAEVGARTLPSRTAPFSLLVAIGAVFLFAVAFPPLVGHALARLGGFVPLAAGREFSTKARRAGTMIAVFAVAVSLSVILSGVATSLGNGIRDSVEAWTRGDLYVLPAQPGKSLRDEKFTPDVARRLASVPGVASVGPFTNLPVEYGGRQVQVFTWATKGISDFVRLNVAHGVRGDAFWRALDQGEVGVSSNFAFLHHLHVGDRLSLPTAAGSRRFRIAAIVRDYTSDSGIVYTALSTYRRITGDSRLFDIALKVAPGQSTEAVAARVRSALPGYPSLVVWTRQQMRDHMLGLFGQLLSVLKLLSLVCFALAILVAAATAAASLAVRRSALGLARLCGATTRSLRAQLGLEAGLVGAVAWLIAFPVGALSIGIALRAVGTQTGLLPPVVVPVPAALVALPIAVLAAGLAVWIPSRRLLGVEVIEAVRQE